MWQDLPGRHPGLGLYKGLWRPQADEAAGVEPVGESGWFAANTARPSGVKPRTTLCVARSDRAEFQDCSEFSGSSLIRSLAELVCPTLSRFQERVEQTSMHGTAAVAPVQQLRSHVAPQWWGPCRCGVGLRELQHSLRLLWPALCDLVGRWRLQSSSYHPF
jgi:hypothetical protein